MNPSTKDPKPAQEVDAKMQQPATMGDVARLLTWMMKNKEAGDERLVTARELREVLALVLLKARDGELIKGFVNERKLKEVLGSTVDVAVARREDSTMSLLLGLETRIARLESKGGK